MFQELTVDLRRQPEDRWHLTPTQRDQARHLLTLYKADLGDFVRASGRELVSAGHWAEMESLARSLELPVGDIVLCNCYYDALKLVLGCTAFAVDSTGGVLHARNLDWWTENAILSRYTAVCHFVSGPFGKFTTIGWPGFIGAFSGVAAGRFAVTLNATLSLERAVPAMPVALLLRSVLEEARSFDEALTFLSEAPLPSDCLLLLTGVHPGELVVVERTPSRRAVRRPQAGFVCVTNDYQQLSANSAGSTSELSATSCHRFLRVGELMHSETPTNPEACFRYLSDPEVRMQITVQQMVFRASTGEYWVRLPTS